MLRSNDRGDCCRLEKLKFAIYSRLREPKLYKHVLRGDWHLIPRRCESHPKEAAFVHKYPPSDTALHGLLRTGASASLGVDCATQQSIDQLKLEAVSALLAAHSMAASTPDLFGRTPLHLACMDVCHCGEAAAYKLVEYCTMCVRMKDIQGRTPLHYLVGRNEHISLALLAKLVTIWPEGLRVRDSVSETPLDILRQRGDEIDNAEAVLQLLKKMDPSLETEHKDAAVA